MSQQRKIRRAMEAAENKRNGVRTHCPKCHAKLVEKPGYGRFCMKCGWTKLDAEEAHP